ncbi:MAG: hypothetical protein EBT50_07645 [Verrucomicrobia bacterium]|jgi:hypothetical protein|nr:hypothetical protein [Verrucomicrobiota bacterium]
MKKYKYAASPIAVLTLLAFGLATLFGPAWAGKPEFLDILAPALKKGAVLIPKMAVATQVMKGDRAVGINLEFEECENDYPSVLLPAPAKGWDLSSYDALEVEIENTGTGSEKSLFCVGMQNFGGSRKNQNGIALVPGEIGFVRVEFGFSWGKPDEKPDLKSIDAIFIFIGPKQKAACVIKSLRAVKN